MLVSLTMSARVTSWPVGTRRIPLGLTRWIYPRQPRGVLAVSGESLHVAL